MFQNFYIIKVYSIHLKKKKSTKPSVQLNPHEENTTMSLWHPDEDRDPGLPSSPPCVSSSHSQLTSLQSTMILTLNTLGYFGLLDFHRHGIKWGVIVCIWLVFERVICIFTAGVYLFILIAV